MNNTKIAPTPLPYPPYPPSTTSPMAHSLLLVKHMIFYDDLMERTGCSGNEVLKWVESELESDNEAA